MSNSIGVVSTYLMSSKEFRVCVYGFRFNEINHASRFQSFGQLDSTFNERSEYSRRFPFKVWTRKVIVILLRWRYLAVIEKILAGRFGCLEFWLWLSIKI